MEKQKHVEILGAISKVEKVRPVGHNILPNSLVLENLEAFPGYHGQNIPEGTQPFYLFLVTKKRYKEEEVLHATKNIRKYFPHAFDARPGEISIYNDTLHFIRIKDLKSYDYIADLQRCFEGEGIELAKKRKLEGQGIITVYKYFNLQEYEKEIYQDLEDHGMFYFVIPSLIKWKEFEAITKSVRNNLLNSNFDAAQGFFYFKEITDMVRIFAKEYDCERIVGIKKQYMIEIDRIKK